MSGKRVGSILALLLLLSGAFIGVLFVSRQTDFFPRAKPEFMPQKIKITNITDSGFNVSWITQDPTIGFIKYGLTASDLAQTSTDERDQLTGDSGDFKTHYVTIQGLKPATTYFFKLGSHGKQLYDNNGQAFSLTTAPAKDRPASVDSAYGTVLTPAQTPAEGSLVYLSLPGGVPLSALVKQNGNWTIDLASIRTVNLENYVSYDPNTTPIEILVRDVDGNGTQVTTTSANDQPVPTIVLGQNSIQTTNASGPLPESKFSLAPVVVTDPEADGTLVLVNPQQNGTVVNTQKPQFQGKAPPSVTLTVTLQSAPVYTQSITVGKDGNWSWLPPGNLTPGSHTLTISYTEQGILHTLTRTFVVHAGEGDLGYSATPSASLSPTKIPTMSPTQSAAKPTVTLKPTSVPTLVLSPTARPTPLIPQAGTTLPTVSFVTLGIIGIVLGYLFKKIHHLV